MRLEELIILSSICARFIVKIQICNPQVATHHMAKCPHVQIVEYASNNPSTRGCTCMKIEAYPLMTSPRTGPLWNFVIYTRCSMYRCAVFFLDQIAPFIWSYKCTHIRYTNPNPYPHIAVQNQNPLQRRSIDQFKLPSTYSCLYRMCLPV